MSDVRKRYGQTDGQTDRRCGFLLSSEYNKMSREKGIAFNFLWNRTGEVEKTNRTRYPLRHFIRADERCE